MSTGRLHPLLKAVFFLFLLLALLPAARAQLTIEIVGSGGKEYPIAIAAFRAEGGLPQSISSVVAADLQRSGVFRIVDAGGVNPPHEPQDVNYQTWRARGAEAIVIGTISALS